MMKDFDPQTKEKAAGKPAFFSWMATAPILLLICLSIVSQTISRSMGTHFIAPTPFKAWMLYVLQR